MATADPSRLNAKQQAAIEALLTEDTLAAVGEKAGVCRQTVAKWLKDKDFQAVYTTVRRRAVDHGVARLQGAMVQAVKTLQKGLDAAEESDRIRAADALLKHILKGVEQLDLAEQLRQIQDQIDAFRNPNGPQAGPGCGAAAAG